MFLSELLEAKKNRLRSLESLELMSPEDLYILAQRRMLKAEIAELERQFDTPRLRGLTSHAAAWDAPRSEEFGRD